jgi:hypothetical protein
MSFYAKSSVRPVYPANQYKLALSKIETVTSKKYQSQDEVERIVWTFLALNIDVDPCTAVLDENEEPMIFTLWSGNTYGNSKSTFTKYGNMMLDAPLQPAAVPTYDWEKLLYRVFDAVVVVEKGPSGVERNIIQSLFPIGRLKDLGDNELRFAPFKNAEATLDF